MFGLSFFPYKDKFSRKALFLPFICLLFFTFNKSTNVSRILTLIAIFIGLTIFVYILNLRKSSKIHLFHNQNFQSKNIALEKLTYLKDAKFIPTPYLSHPFLQALYNHKTSLFKSDQISINFHREYVRLPDCGQVSVDSSFIDYSLKKLIIIIHGLTGGSDMPYVRAMIQEAHKKGFNALVFHNRGINKTFLTTPEPFHGAKVDDFDYTMKYIKEKYHEFDLYIAGFSFGANQLMRYLGTEEHQKYYKAAVAISLPFDLEETARKIDGTLYSKAFVKQYNKNIIKPNLEILVKNLPNINFNDVFQASSVSEFHRQFSIKIFGYSTVEEYLQASCVTLDMIDHIKIPVLILNSKDDAISLRSDKHVDAITKNENILYAETEKGGHVCWFEGANPKRWYPKPAIEFLNAF